MHERAAPRGRPLLLAALLVGALALSVVMVRGMFGGGAPRYDVLIVTIDTLRADAERADMPALYRLADRGLHCGAARTVVPLTLPAHASLLTGRAPPVHGIRDNTAAPLPPREQRDFSTLAEEFQARGYATAAFVASAVLDKRFGLDAGFSHYQAPPPPAPGKPRFATLDASEQVARVREWMAGQRGDRPRFVWVHIWEPHEPYRPYAGDPLHPERTVEGDPPRERYWGEVRRADAALDAIVRLFDAERTLIVVVSDHGESLGEHGEKSHGFLTYGATMDIPLVIAGPGIPAAARPTPTSILDIAPTLRQLCGFPPRGSDGVSLLSPMESRVLVGESLYGNRVHNWAQVSVATDGRYSLVDAGARVELYDRETDPGETRPISDPAAHPAYESLDRALLAYQQQKGPDGGGGNPAERVPGYAPDSDSNPYYSNYGGATPYGTVRRPVGRFLPRAENRKLADPVVSLPVDDEISRMRAAIDMRSGPLVKHLIGSIEELERLHTDDPSPSMARGRALLLVLKRPAEASDALKEARRRGYRSVGLARMIAVADALTLVKVGQTDEAIRLLEATQDKHGEDPRIAAQLAALRNK